MKDSIRAGVRLGWHVFPVRGKIPATPNGFQDALGEGEDVDGLFRQYPSATGYGVSTGASGLVVLDVDTDEAKGKVGAASLAALEAEYVIPETLTVMTGSGGLHLYFRAPLGVEVPSSNSRVGQDLDVKARGGYVVGPGSLHPNGVRYELVEDLPVAACPQWLTDLATAKPKAGQAGAPTALGVALDKPSEAEIKGAMVQWKKLARHKASAATALAAMRAVFRNEAFAKAGAIHDTSVELAYWLLGSFPRMDHVWFADHWLERAWLHTEWPGGTEYGPDRARRHWDRCWSTGVDKRAAESAAMGAARAARTESAIADAFGGRRNTPYTDEEIKVFSATCGVDPAHFAKRWIIQVNNVFFLWFDGGYTGPFRQQELLSAAAKWLAPAEGRVRLMTTAPDGGFCRRNVDQLLSDYCTHASRLSYDLTARTGTYDVENHTLIEATCPHRDQELGGALESKAVGAWLSDLCGGPGRGLDLLLDWMASCPELDQAAPAVWFLGGAGKGKSLFTKGMAQLWHAHGRACSLDDAMGRFNSDILRCPLVAGDESIPKDPRGRPMVDELKLFISADSHRIERKGMDLDETRGACRVVISANNDSVMALQETLTKSDMRALSDRMILIEIPDGLEAIPKDTAEGWLGSGAIARHALWLHENREVTSNGRFICGSHGEAVATKLIDTSELHDKLLGYVAACISKPKAGLAGPLFGEGIPAEPTVRVVGADGGQILICAGLLWDEWQEQGRAASRIKRRDLRSALDGLTEGRLRPRPTVEGSPRKWYQIVDPCKLLRWVENSDYDETDFLLALDDRIKEAAGVVPGIGQGLN